MSRSDYKNIYEGYLDNTGYKGGVRYRERYGGCGSEPMPYEMNEKPVMENYNWWKWLTQPGALNTGNLLQQSTTPTPTQQQAQTEIINTYNNTKTYVDKFRKIATEYYIYGGTERFAALNTKERNSGDYAKYVRYIDVTKKNWVAYNGSGDTHPSSCNLLNTVRTNYFRNGYKSEICCNDNKTYYNYCYFNDEDESIANSIMSLDVFTFRVDVLKDEIRKNYPNIDQTKLTFPSVYFTDQQFTTPPPPPTTTSPPPTTGSAIVRDYCDPNTTPSVRHLKYNTRQQCNKDGGTWNISKNNLGKCDAYCTTYK